MAPPLRVPRLDRAAWASAPTEAASAQIESLDLAGRGVARVDGKVVFIEGALPGERVRWRKQRSKPRFDSGQVVAVLSPSALRAQPRCPHFGFDDGNCGGCSMQHLDPQAQVAAKQRALEECLVRLGGVRPDLILRPVYGPTWHYRHRARLTVRYIDKKGGALVGFHERASSYVADLRVCPVLAVSVADLLVPLRALVGALSIRDRLPQIEVAVAGQTTVLVLRILAPLAAVDRCLLQAFAAQHRVALWLQPAGPDSAEPLDASAAQALALPLPEFGLSLPFGPTDFTQVNHRTNEILVRRAVALLDPNPQDRIADFFCGMGNFTLPLATRSTRVIGIDGNASLLSRASAAARNAGLADRVDFEVRNLFAWQPADWQALCATAGGRIERVLIDPPRDGALALVQSLAADPQALRRMVYVSCNPATLARDCGVLVGTGRWRLSAAGIVNMFPHTSHVESMAVLETEL